MFLRFEKLKKWKFKRFNGFNKFKRLAFRFNKKRFFVDVDNFYQVKELQNTLDSKNTKHQIPNPKQQTPNNKRV